MEASSGLRVLITAGASGIGRGIAEAFVWRGDRVHICDVNAELLAAAPGVTGSLADVSRAADVERLFEDVRTHLGGLDVLVCNAAFQMTHDELRDFPPDQVRRTFETNVFSTFWLVHELAPQLADGGSIVVTTSVQAYQPSSHLVDYAATKAALTNMVVNLAQELGAQGTRVNAVAPGPIWTPLIPATMSADKVEGFGADVPLGRAGHPVEVAAAYVFLASDEASYVSGTVLGVTGGKPVF